MLDLRRHGPCKDCTLEILSSSGAISLPLMTAANVVALRWARLRRFINQALLPPGATIANRIRPRRLPGTVLAMAVLAVVPLIGGLLVQRQRAAEQALRSKWPAARSAEDKRRRLLSCVAWVARGAARERIGGWRRRRAPTNGGPFDARGERTAEIAVGIHPLPWAALGEIDGLSAAVRGHCRELVTGAHHASAGLCAMLSYDVEVYLFRIYRKGSTTSHQRAVREAQVTLTGTKNAVVLTPATLAAGSSRTGRPPRPGPRSMRERAADWRRTHSSIAAGSGTTITG